MSGSTGAASRGLEACSTATLALREQRMLEIAEKLQKLVGRQNRNLRLLADGALRQVGICFTGTCDTVVQFECLIHGLPLSGIWKFCSSSGVGSSFC